MGRAVDFKDRSKTGAGAEDADGEGGRANVEAGGIRRERRAIGDQHVVKRGIGDADGGQREGSRGSTANAAAVDERRAELAPLVGRSGDGAGRDDGKCDRLPRDNRLPGRLGRDRRDGPRAGGGHKKSRERKQAAGSETTGSARREGRIIHGGNSRARNAESESGWRKVGTPEEGQVKNM